MGIAGVMLFCINFKASPVETWFSLGGFEVGIFGLYWGQHEEQTLDLIITTTRLTEE